MNMIFHKVHTNPDIWSTSIDAEFTDVRLLPPFHRNEMLRRTILEPVGVYKDLIYYLQGRDFKERLVDVLCTGSQFKDSWGPEFIKRMHDVTEVSAAICAEDTHVVGKTHLDYRTDVASGMIFLDNEDKPNRATSFYRDVTKQPVYRASTEQGKGWFLPNSHNSWHNGGNRSADIRYFVIYNLKLRIF